MAIFHDNRNYDAVIERELTVTADLKKQKELTETVEGKVNSFIENIERPVL